MHNIPDRTDMIFDLLRKGQRFVHQATDSLPQRVVQTLDMAGLSAFLADRPVPFRRQDTRRGIPKIAGTYCTLPIHGLQRLLELLRGCFVMCSDGYPNNFPCVTVKRQSHPFLLVLVVNKRSPFITSDGQSAFWFGLDMHLTRLVGIFLVDIRLEPAFRHLDNPCDANQRDAFKQQTVNDVVDLIGDDMPGWIIHELAPQALQA